MDALERPGSDDRSPLIVIRQKEIEIAERLAAARRAAEHKILESHHVAAEVRVGAERAGHEAAAALLQSELAAADTEAENMCVQGARMATQIAERGAEALDLASQRIVEYVLPKLPSG